MVTILPREDQLGDIFKGVGQGFAQGYTNRADEMALQNAIGGLAPNATPRQILDAVTGTKTFSPDSKQNLLKNYLGVAEFEEIQRKNKAAEEVNSLKNELEKKKEAAKLQAQRNDALTLIDASKLDHAEKEALRNKVNNGEASFDAIKEVLKPNKDDLKKAAKEEEENKAQEITQRAFNDIVSLIPDVGRSGILTSQFGGDTARAYSQFTSLTGALESLLVEKVNRGALSNARFKYITETLLPKPSDSQADIRGKLQGLATILDLDPSALQGEKTQNKPSLSSFKKG